MGAKRHKSLLQSDFFRPRMEILYELLKVKYDNFVLDNFVYIEILTFILPTKIYL